MQCELKKGDIPYVCEIVKSEQEYIEALTSFQPDIILSDFTFPSFNGPLAFKIKETLAPGTPFILVSGTIGEEKAVELIKAGVTDFVLKDNLLTLNIKVKRALKDHEEKRQKNITEQDLQESEQLLRLALHGGDLGYWEWKVETGELLVNERWLTMLGLDTGFVPDIDFWHSLVHPDDLALLHQVAQEVIFSSVLQNLELEIRVRHTNGKYVWILDKATVVKRDKDGKPLRVIGTHMEITKRKEEAEKIKNSEERIKLIMNAALDAIICMDINGNISFWNPQAEVIFGWKEAEVMHKRLSAFIIPEPYRDLHDNGMDSFLTTGKGPMLNALIELLAIKKTGEEFPIELTIIPIQQGPEQFFCAFIRDITKRKKAETEIQESNRRYNYVTKATSEVIWDWDLVTDNMYRGEGFHDILGSQPSQTAANGFNSGHIHPEDVERVMDGIDELIAGTKSIWKDEYRLVKKDQVYAFVADKGLIVRDDSGRAIRLVGAMQDITKRKREEQHLKLLESVITNTNDAVLITEAEPLDEPGPRIIYVNEAFTKMTGYTADEVIGKNPRLLQGEKSDKAEIAKIGRCLKRWESCQMTIINYKKNGEEFWNNMSISPVADEKGWYTHWISIERDVTESKLLEIELKKLNEELQKQARELAISNEELEQFAYVASHDLQEPLRMVTSFLTQLEKKYAGVIDDKGKKYIAFAVDGAKRMRQIILDLLEFSRIGRSDDSKQDINLNDLLKETQILFRKQIEEKKATFIIDTLPVIYAHQSPMRQVFQNLVFNALKFSIPGVPAVIHIDVKETETCWQFAVSDNGIGIEAEYFDKIFIIFQQLHSKDQFSGTGMGLAIAKKIIENQGGKIWVESEAGKGSTFYFTITKTHP
jgi:PAS domain S-box-containing protein